MLLGVLILSRDKPARNLYKNLAHRNLASLTFYNNHELAFGNVDIV